MKRKVLFVVVLGFFLLTAGCYSCKTWQHLNHNEPADKSVSFMWDKGCKPAPLKLPNMCLEQPKPVEPPQPPPPPPAPVPAPVPVVVNCAEKIYPCGACGNVKLEKCMPSQVQTGAEFNYTIRVTNLTGSDIADVVVTDTIVSNLQYKNGNPAADVQGNKLMWVFPSIGPGETKEINSVAIATAGGIIQNCVDLTYRVPLCLQSVSVQPMVAVSRIVPAEVSICDAISYTIRVENTGTGPANNVRVTDELPCGLTTAQGAGKVDVMLGTLAGGTARNITVAVTAQKAGVYTGSAVATADGGIKVMSPASTIAVKSPKLSLTQKCSDVQYLDRELVYDITVSNIGDWAAVNTIIETQIPAGASFVRASDGGALVGGKVVWKIASLAPGATANVSAVYMPGGIGTLISSTTASAGCCESVSATAQTKVVGVPAILLEVVDITDPIKVGQSTTYQIIATNQGSAVGTNISIVATLEPEMTYVSCAGATSGMFADGTITFAPLPTLAAKTKAIWNVTVKANAVKDVRFKAKMISDQLERDVWETESTHFYE
ncbi:MAG TPA: hypothetical protein DDW84_08065 [Phycisphaerales bacterium]|nr:MAG: hypothetical protein A2Y13_01485 [Planctomycetes bacterium GWC2_45_44]HBG78778.1 hypothetical protein [Phycisphaerales bacterium]HBR20240.1 hypothetical protein [Phycisphaerales bacterium]